MLNWLYYSLVVLKVVCEWQTNGFQCIVQYKWNGLVLMSAWKNLFHNELFSNMAGYISDESSFWSWRYSRNTDFHLPLFPGCAGNSFIFIFVSLQSNPVIFGCKTMYMVISITNCQARVSTVLSPSTLS